MMKSHTHTQSPFATTNSHVLPANHQFHRVLTTKRRRINLQSSRIIAASNSEHSDHNDGITLNSDAPRARTTRRAVLAAPFLAAGSSFLLSAAAAKAEEKAAPAPTTVADSTVSKPDDQKKEEEEIIASRIYDATVIGEPLAIGKEKGKVWEKLMNARVVYLGEAEQVPVRDDKELEFEIVKNLHRRCLENDKRLSLALEAFPSNLQEQLNQYMDSKYAFETFNLPKFNQIYLVSKSSNLLIDSQNLLIACC